MLLVPALVSGVGCMGTMVSTGARLGDTIGIPVGGELTEGALVGYGTADYTDAQRGSLIFRLLNDQDVQQGPDLEPIFVTRTGVDPASMAGIENDAWTGSANGEISQIMALVTLPTDGIATGAYDLVMGRKDGTGNEITDPLQRPAYRLPFEVLPGAAPANPVTWDGYISSFGNLFGPIPISAAVRNRLIPKPKVVFSLPTTSPGSTPPAASHLKISYDEFKIDGIIAVLEEEHLGRQSIVTFSDDTVNDEVTIDIVDPTQSGVFQFSLVFDLSPSAPSIVSTTDFTIVEELYYDADGVEITGLPSPAAIPAVIR